jgi:hypothetical protein
LDAAGSRNKPRQWRLRQMINNFHLYWSCSISSDGFRACTYRPDDNSVTYTNGYYWSNCNCLSLICIKLIFIQEEQSKSIWFIKKTSQSKTTSQSV